MSESPYGEPTLDDLIAGAWEELAVRGLARCPVCGGQMHAEIESAPAFDADGAVPLEEDELDLTATLSGACADCGTRFD